VIARQLFHETVRRLAGTTLAFELLGGITVDEVRDHVEKMEDQIIG
jgi:hypothetical protein